MPIPHLPPRGLRRDFRGLSAATLAWLAAIDRKRPKRRKDSEDGGVPVEPDRPRDLSGGAAAALDFEEG